MKRYPNEVDGVAMWVVPCDSNGNPRRVVSFFQLLNDEESRTLVGAEGYELARKRARQIGGTKYRGSDFGGGFVFQCWSEQELAKYIKQVAGRGAE